MGTIKHQGIARIGDTQEAVEIGKFNVNAETISGVPVAKSLGIYK